MNPDEPSNDALPPTVDESGRREYYTPPPDYPLQPCDFKKWSRRDSIAIEQACFVLLGYEPPPLPVLRFVQDTYNPSEEPTWDAPPGYDDMLHSLRLSIEHGNISAKRIREGKYATSHVTLPDLVRWARPKEYEIAPELESIITKMEAGAPVQNTATLAPVVIESASAGVELDKAGPDDKKPWLVADPTDPTAPHHWYVAAGANMQTGATLVQAQNRRAIRDQFG